jgi:hypothetical protein
MWFLSSCTIIRQSLNLFFTSLRAGTSVEALTEFEITQYQIVLWTVLAVVAVAYSAVQAVNHMEIIPDSILYSKFISTKTKMS